MNIRIVKKNMAFFVTDDYNGKLFSNG